MARRIALTVIALIAILLSTVVVPLGMITAGQDRRDFEGEAATATAALAGVAEEHLDDRSASRALARSIAELSRHGDQVAVYGRAGRWVAGAATVAGLSGRLIQRALAGTQVIEYPTTDRMLVVTPISTYNGSRVGAVALSRSTEPLDQRRARLWAWLAVVSAAGLAAAALIAAGLARWVGRPLGALEHAAQRLGQGELQTRSPSAAGPREVRRLAANFNAMAARLEALVDGHQAMMADVSHQLRTPLAALRLRLDVLGLQLPEQLADEAAGAQEEVARLSRMVDGLLAVARAENASAAPVSVPVDAVIGDRASAWGPAADEKSVTLEVTLAEPLTVRLGEGQLEQILDNLLANALEAVPTGGRIQVGAQLAGDRVRIVVADDGPGMSPAARHAAFRRYTSATPGGTGLGLAIVHRLVTSAGGTAELSDTNGGGLTVILELPAAPRDRGTRRPVIPSVTGQDL